MKTSDGERPATAWGRNELDDPHSNASKARKVRDMFSAIARSYDLNNRLHSLWMDVGWRRLAVRMAAVKPGDEVLDVACGTGDLSQAFATMTPAARVVGSDFTPAMLDLARVKQRRQAPKVASRLSYVEADAQSLPFPDASFDVVSIAFGIRNVQDPTRAFSEFARVLRPAGRLVVLEFDTPRLVPVRWFNDFYAGRVMPVTATVISGDRSGAYSYLPKSVRTFLSRDALIEAIVSAGFMAPKVRELSMGICCCYGTSLANRPERP